MNKRIYVRKHLLQMSTPQLERLLQEEIQKATPDRKAVLTILDVLKGRDTKEATEINVEIENAWDSFREQCAADTSIKGRKQNWVIKFAAAAAILCVVALAVPTALGAGNVFQAIARWTDSVFSFFDQPDQPDTYEFETKHPGLQEIYEAVTELGITQPVVPTWVPEGYELTELETDTQANRKKMNATLRGGSNEMILSISMFHHNASMAYTKDKSQVIVLEKEGVKHHVMRNDNTWTVTWIIEKGECMLSTDCREDELYRILDSIYYTEDD